MKRIILQLMSELSTVTAPFNPVDINKIFAKHQPLDATQIQPKLKKHVEQLLALKALAEQSFDLANQRHYLSAQQERLTLLAEEKNTTQQTIDKLLNQMQQSIELVNASFHKLMPQINENLLKQNKLTPPYNAAIDNKTQKIAVKEYHSQLSKSLNEMDTRVATLTLVQLKQAKHRLIDELSTLGINLSAREGKNSLQKLIPSISLSVSQLKEIKPKMSDLHQLFAKKISLVDVQKKIKELELQTANNEKQLDVIELEIAINTLEPKIKERLSEEFQKSTHKSELIKAYQDKLPSALTYIDPYAWKSWIQDQHKYEVAQQEAHNSVTYLQLLEKEHNLKLDKNRLVDQIKTLDSLIPTAQASSENDADINKLIGQAKILFNDCALLQAPIGIPSGATASDFYLALRSYIPIIEQKLKQMAVVLIKLHALNTLKIEIIQLRTQYNFEANIDFLLATQKDFEQLTQLIETQKPAKEVLMQQHELCKSFFANATKLEEIKKQLQAAIVHKTDIGRTLSVTNLATPIQNQISIISEQLSNLRSVIATHIEQINRLPLPNEPEEPSVIEDRPMEQSTSSDAIILTSDPGNVCDKQLMSIVPVDLTTRQPSTPTSMEQLISSPPHTQKRWVEPLETTDDVVMTPKKSSSIQPEFQKWQNAYQQGLTYLQYHPIDIQQWCMDLYKAIEMYSNDDDSYKTSHLIRDILFELQYKKDLDVIRAYMRLCPNPEKDLNKILSLKPNLPLLDEPFDEVTELQDAPAELKSLYAQYMKLKKDHSIEGELLLQAIHSLRVAKISIDTPNCNISVTQVPSLSKDPRYELLKRHRGFFKVWEAIEDFCRMLIGKIMGQAEFEYTKRPCFFRTKSAQLVEEADLIIQKDLLPLYAT